MSHVNDDASVGIQAIKYDGTKDTTTKMLRPDEFGDYNILKPDQQLKVAQPKYPIFSNIDAVYRMVADIAMYKAFQEHPVPPDTMIMQTVPRKRLVAIKAIASGSLTLVPWSYGVNLEAVDVKKDNVFYIEVAAKPPKLFAIQQPSDLGKKFELEFWRMGRDKDAANANMTCGTLKFQIDWPIDVGNGKSVNVNVPIAKNNKAIKPEHEIKLHVVAKPSKRKAMEISMSDIADNKLVAK